MSIDAPAIDHETYKADKARDDELERLRAENGVLRAQLDRSKRAYRAMYHLYDALFHEHAELKHRMEGLEK